jgi:hypothetical protein
LKEEFDVWYDQARITVGDSIYEKISQGIRECDFGVVVFSPDYDKGCSPLTAVSGSCTMRLRITGLQVRRSVGNVGIPKRFPRGVGGVESPYFGFLAF